MKDNPPQSPVAASRAVSRELSDKLYVQIIQKLGVEKHYLDANYTARQLAEEIGTNPRYISDVVARHTGGNYSKLINGYRLRDAQRMLRSPRYARYTAEEIGLMCGFSSRQAFYLAFNREVGCTPRHYRLKNTTPHK